MKDIFTFDEPTHTYRLNGIILPSVSQILKETGFVNTEFFTEEGKIRGTETHKACWYYDEDDFSWDNVDESLHGYVQAYINFKKEADFVPWFIEKKLYSKLYMFGCTPDRAGRLGNNPNAIVEIKTGVPGIWASLQTAAQKIVLEEAYPERGFHKRFSVQLKEDGKYKLLPYKDQSDKNIFLSALTLCHWRRKHGIKHGD